MRRMRKTRTVIAACAMCLILSTLLVCLYSAGIFGATSFHFTSSSAELSYTPPKESVSDQATRLENCGFKITDDGELLTLETASSWGSTGASTLVSRHNQLKENGILSYFIYSNSVCNVMTDLVVCLDFSNYRISTFSSDFLQAITYAITGSLSLFGQGASFNESTTDGTVKLYDVAMGGEIKTMTANLHLRGITGSNNTTSYINYYDLNGNKLGDTHYITSYSLRIILPSNTWTEGELTTITFESGSLVSSGIGSLSASPPTSIGLDITNVTFDNVDRVAINSNATEGKTTHFHYIASSQAQLLYCAQESLNYVLGTASSTNYTEEVFIKPYLNTAFCRIAIGFHKTGSEYSIEFYDEPNVTQTQEQSDESLLRTMQWLVYSYDFPGKLAAEDLSYTHRVRDPDSHQVTDDVGTITTDFTRATGGQVKLHELRCSHGGGTNPADPTLIGYFDSQGRVYNAYGAELLSVAE